MEDSGEKTAKQTVMAAETGMSNTMIYTIRNTEVILDSDLAALYGTPTKVFNQAVNRNTERFPETFRFQLTQDEFDYLRSQNVTSSPRRKENLGANIFYSNYSNSNFHGGRRHLPYVFTEQGVAMLSAVLRSESAIKTSVQIINAFVTLRRRLMMNDGLVQRMDILEQRQLTHEIKINERMDEIFDALEGKSRIPEQGVFFEGQVFDAYVFINDLIRQAEKSIVLLDNYVNDSTLQQLAKRKDGVTAVILAKSLTKSFMQDLKKHNDQYPQIEIGQFSHSHDRFLIIDSEHVYHIGASLKDLGKKMFAFSKMNKSGLKVMEQIDAVLQNEKEFLDYE